MKTKQSRESRKCNTNVRNRRDRIKQRDLIKSFEFMKSKKSKQSMEYTKCKEI